MDTKIKEIELDKACLHIEGYVEGFNDARLQMTDQLNSLLDMKAEYDRAFCIIRHAGITKEETKKLSTALALLLNKHASELVLLNEKEKENG